MPIESHVDGSRRRIVATITGDFSFEEILQAINRSVRDPSFRQGYSIISDHTAVGEPLTAPQAAKMVAHLESLREFVANSRWAVVTSKPASYGMLRMVSVLAESVPMQVQVFLSHKEAEAWISSPRTEEA